MSDTPAGSEPPYGLRPGEVRDFGAADPRGNKLRFLPDEETILRPVWNLVEFWSASSGEKVHEIELPGEMGLMGPWDLHPSGEALVCAGWSAGPRALSLSGAELTNLEIPEAARAYLISESPGLGTFGGVHRTDGTYEDQSRRYAPYSVACDVAISPGGDMAAIAYGQAYVIVWDLQSGEMITCLGEEGPPERPIRIYRVDWGPDPSRVATVDSARRLRICNLDGDEVFSRTLREDPHRDAVDRPADMPAVGMLFGALGAIRFTPDGRKLAAGDGAVVRVWDVASGRERGSWKGHGSRHPILGQYRGVPRILDISFSEDGKRALTVGVDATIRVWEVDSGRQVWAERPDPCCTDFADLAPDGRHVIWSACPGTRLYRID